MIDIKPMTSDKTFLVAANFSPKDWSFEICTTPKVIGSASGVDIKIERAGLGVARQHASFWTDGCHWVEDLNSSLGTFVNRVRLIPLQKTSIVVGDHILVGLMELHVISETRLIWMQHLEGMSLNDSQDTIYLDNLKRIGHPASLDMNLLQTVISELTKSEHEIIVWLMRGIVSETEIAKRTFRSPNTIRTHMNNIHRKLDVHSRHELMALLLRRESGNSE